MASGADHPVIVEFFGPFRMFGKERDLDVPGAIAYGRLVEMLGAELGSEFAEQAGKKNTTVIVNNRIVSRSKLELLQIEPGDKVAFALLLGGG